MACTGFSWCDVTRRASHRKALCFLKAALWPFQSNFRGKGKEVRCYCSGNAGEPTAPLEALLPTKKWAPFTSWAARGQAWFQQMPKCLLMSASVVHWWPWCKHSKESGNPDTLRRQWPRRWLQLATHISLSGKSILDVVRTAGSFTFTYVQVLPLSVREKL